MEKYYIHEFSEITQTFHEQKKPDFIPNWNIEIQTIIIYVVQPSSLN